MFVSIFTRSGETNHVLLVSVTRKELYLLEYRSKNYGYYGYEWFMFYAKFTIMSEKFVALIIIHPLLGNGRKETRG